MNQFYIGNVMVAYPEIKTIRIVKGGIPVIGFTGVGVDSSQSGTLHPGNRIKRTGYQ